MSHRRWYFAAGACLLAAVIFAGCTAWTAREVSPELDAAGLSEEQAKRFSLPEQYDLAAKRYRVFNDFVSATQRKFYDGGWISAEGSNVHMAMRGNAFSGALNGEATDTNSYYLTRFWRLENIGDAEERLDAARNWWNSEGWETTKSDSDIYPGTFRVTATTEDGTWIALDMARGGINLTAYTGVYWGDTEALAAAIWNIQQNERNEGIDWRPEKVNADGDGLIRPGEYPPYPAWNEVAYEERLEKSSLWVE